jgi:hypothetical protein
MSPLRDDGKLTLDVSIVVREFLRITESLVRSGVMDPLSVPKMEVFVVFIRNFDEE